MKHFLYIAIITAQLAIQSAAHGQAQSSSFLMKNADLASSYGRPASRTNMKFSDSTYYNTSLRLNLCLKFNWLCASFGLEMMSHRFSTKLSTEVSTRLYEFNQIGGASAASLELHPLGWALPPTSIFTFSPYISADYGKGTLSSASETVNSNLPMTKQQIASYKSIGAWSGLRITAGSKFRMLFFVGKQRVSQSLDTGLVEFDVVPIGAGLGISL